MIVRLVYFAVSPDKVDAVKKFHNDEAMPVIKSQKGNLACRLLEPVNKDDDYISMTTWDNREDADAYQNGGAYRKLVEKARPLFKSDPVLKVYMAEDILEHA
jgi:heme-degrading monooxygenase HmoA